MSRYVVLPHDFWFTNDEHVWLVTSCRWCVPADHPWELVLGFAPWTFERMYIRSMENDVNPWSVKG